MRKFRSSLLRWLPVFVWMVMIFSVSGDKGSFPRSSRIIAPLLKFILPHISDESVGRVVLVIRKGAHLTEYAILAFLVWNAVRKPVWRDKRPWLWSEAVIVLWVAALYAATDEFHQTFIPSREGCLRDVLIDSSGAAIGLLLLWAFGRWRKFW